MDKFTEALPVLAWRMFMISIVTYAVFGCGASPFWYIFAVAMCGVSPYNYY